METTTGNITNGGTITPEQTKKGKRKKGADQVPDCFRPETMHMHQGKGGDGFEAWKGNKKVIKKQKLGIRKEEIKVLTKEG